MYPVRVSCARGEVFQRDAFTAALTFITQLKSAVVKPSQGRKGKGVSVSVTQSSFPVAWQQALDAEAKEILVEEEFISGVEARYLVVYGKVVAVVLRKPPSVEGDGRSTIRQLIRQKNIERSKNRHLARRYPIKLDKFRLGLLGDAGFSPESIPEEGMVVQLDQKSNISSGGESHDITDIVHPTMLDIARRAAQAIPGLKVAGVDVLARDHTKPATEDSYIVVEINTHPGLGLHHFPLHGKGRNVSAEIISRVIDSIESPLL